MSCVASVCRDNDACTECLGLGAGEACTEHLDVDHFSSEGSPDDAGYIEPLEHASPTTLPPLGADADNVVFAGWSGGSFMAQ